jgi:molybdopterin-guanine dinucleotide biosynthesis protein B
VGRIIAIAGASGVGKTTAILELVPKLMARGFRVACLKRSHHGFDPTETNQEKDSQRLAQLAPSFFWGKDGLWDGRTLRLVRWTGSFNSWVERLAQQFDVVVLEGGKNSRFDKLELIESGRGFTESVCITDGLIATIGDVLVGEIPCLQRSRADDWIDFLERHWQAHKLG